MTEHRICATDKGLPETEVVKDDLFTKAVKLQGLLRTCICAEHTTLYSGKMFGDNSGVSLTLEVAEKICDDIICEIEDLQKLARVGPIYGGRNQPEDSA